MSRPHSRGRAAPRSRNLPGFFDVGGVRVAVEESHSLPLVDFEFLLCTGAVHDPEGAEGLTRLMWRILRRGVRGQSQAAVEEEIAGLGARLGIGVSTSYVRVHGSVIRRNLEPFFALVSRLVREPAFRGSDIAQAKRETFAELVRFRDDDRLLAARWLRRTLFADHPYGRSVIGDKRSLRRLGKKDLVAHHARHLVAKNVVVGFSGDIDEAEASRLVRTHLSGLSRRAAPVDRVPGPRRHKGRRIVVVDKPERTQTQVFIGTLGVAAGDKRSYPLWVANTAFGGTFSAPLMQEVREKRGWSYGVASRVGADRRRDAFTIWSHPGSADAVDCIALELALLEDFVGGGLTREQVTFAKRYLLRSHCFEKDTASKRLEPRLDVALYDLPTRFWADYEKSVRAVTVTGARRALAEVISADDLVITLTATAKDVVPGLEKLPGVRSVDVVPYDAA